MNLSKTEGMWSGANRPNETKHFGIAWSSEPVFALGIHFLNNDTVSLKKNFDQRLISMENLLNLWYARNLTLHGRITILKSLALSKLVYNTSILSLPLAFINRVNQVIKNFLWGKKVKILKA